ncbi:MAG: VOC family protein, partial [Gemmatimonadaceae bacterium]|nr:VOC family protein [Gemmatimonadaceae bacterium]
MMAGSPTSFRGLRTVVYAVHDLDRARAWYSEVLERAPYFTEDFYVGFDVGGFELGIVPEPDAPLERDAAGVAFWGVGDADAAYRRLLDLGAHDHEPVQDVGGGVKIGAVRDPFGNVLGVVENPAFRFSET